MDAMQDDTSTGLSVSGNDPGLYALPVVDRVIAALEPVGISFGVGAPTPDNLQNILGTTRDRFTLIQMIGPRDRLVRSEVLLTIPRNFQQVAQIQGRLLIVYIALVIPGWDDGPTTVGAAISKVRRHSPQVIYAPGEVKITLTYRKRINLLLRIEWPKLLMQN
jgi:hypothetical protein